MLKAFVQADDLSGAAEVAITFSSLGLATRVFLQSESVGDEVEVAVRDTDSRALDPAGAREATAASLMAAGPGVPVLKKIDSLWRGNIRDEVGALTDAGYDVLLAGAQPGLKRSVVGGRPFVDGVPLRETTAWAVEAKTPPQSVQDLFASSLPLVSLEQLRTATPDELSRVIAPAGVTVFDGQTDDDLRAVIAVWQRLRREKGRRVALAGTGPLASALAESLKPEERALGRTRSYRPEEGDSRSMLAVVGSASLASQAQLEVLSAAGFEVLKVDVTEYTSTTDGKTATAVASHLRRGQPVALSLSDGPLMPNLSQSFVARLAEIADQAQSEVGPSDLILTGGETARAILDRLGISVLEPISQVSQGAVVNHTDDGRLVATKPGSFGERNTLLQIHREIQWLRSGGSR